jgi:type I restriction enzyme S subunit
MIKASATQLDLIRKILRERVPEAEVRVFGSRITELTKNYSDMDIVIVGKKSLSPRILALLKADFEESDLPFRVDILDWYKISEEFKKVIGKKYEIL